jgi:dihydroorotate dehydrogenase (NAD+) catalytic subunit
MGAGRWLAGGAAGKAGAGGGFGARDGGAPGIEVDLTARVGSVTLPNPAMTASGTAGHGAELAAYFDLRQLGAVVTKSVSVEPWAGNPAPRIHPSRAGMLNSVGLQNPGIKAWLAADLVDLAAAGARVVASIWGFRADDYRAVAEALAVATPGPLVAVEANISCPNVEDRSRMFAHSAAATEAAVAAAAAGLDGAVPLWAKLSPNVTDLPAIAAAARRAGADAVVLTNTLMGMAVDPVTGQPVLGGGGGGLSGAALHPVAVRAVYECRAALPDLPIVGVGGVTSGEDAAELLAAGADAVQVGTATFADPRAPLRVLHGLSRWCADHGVVELGQLVSRAHRRGDPGDVLGNAR